MSEKSCWLAPWALALVVLPMGAAAQSVPSEGASVETYDYTVEAGDTCPSLARRFFGDRRRYDVLHAYNPEMGPPPHRLSPGMVLHVPRVVPAVVPDARLTAAERVVTARPEDAAEWRAAAVGLELYRGWHVSTETRSSAELTFADTSVLGLREDTLVIIFGDSARRVRRGGTEARIERGSLRTALGELRGEGADAGGGNALHVVTSSAQADLRGGSAVLSVDAAGTSRVSAHEGDVTLSDAAGRGRTRVPEGMGSSVATGARPTRPRPLPAAPTLDAGALRFLSVPGRGADVSGSWQPVAGARLYRIEIARRSSGRDLAAAVEVPAEVTRFSLQGLPAGTYFVRLATIDGDLFESRPSPPVEIHVEDTTVNGPDGAPATFPAIDPLADAAPLALAPGTRIALPDGVRCSDGGPDVTSSLAVRHGAMASCTDASGAAVGLPAYAVPALDIALSTPSLESGRTSSVTLRAADGSPLPEGATLRGRGVRLENVHADGGALVADATPDEGASAASIDVLAADGSTVLATTVVTLIAPPPARVEPEEGAAEEAPEPEPEPEPIRDLGAVVAAPFASSVALRAFEERGVGGALGVAVIDERTAGARVRTSFEMFGTFVDDQLRLSLAVPVDPIGQAGPDEGFRRGSTDVVASAGWIFGRREPVSVLVDLGAWLPTNGESSLGTARFVPSLELTWAVSTGFALRTRQAAIIELTDGGARRWASAYGLDVQLAGPLSWVIEADLTLGEERLSRPADLAFASALSVDVGELAASVGGRFGPVGGDVFAPAELHVTLRGVAP
jgi:hypothetical protein